MTVSIKVLSDDSVYISNENALGDGLAVNVVVKEDNSFALSIVANSVGTALDITRLDQGDFSMVVHGHVRNERPARRKVSHASREWDVS